MVEISNIVRLCGFSKPYSFYRRIRYWNFFLLCMDFISRINSRVIFYLFLPQVLSPRVKLPVAMGFVVACVRQRTILPWQVRPSLKQTAYHIRERARIVTSSNARWTHLAGWHSNWSRSLNGPACPKAHSWGHIPALRMNST